MKPWFAALPFTLLRLGVARILPMWLFVASVMFLVQVAVGGIVHDNATVKTVLKLLDLLPMIKTTLGGDLFKAGNLPSLMLLGYQHPLPWFLYLLLAAGVPAILLGVQSQNGTAKLTFSDSENKTQIYLCACILTFAAVAALAGVMFLGTLAATKLYDFGQPLPMGLFLRVAANNSLVAAAAASFALLAGGLLAGRSLATRLTIAFLTLNYFSWAVAQWWPRVSFLKPATFFYYSNTSKLVRGWPTDDIGVLLLVILAGSIVGGLAWHRSEPAAVRP